MKFEPNPWDEGAVVIHGNSGNIKSRTKRWQSKFDNEFFEERAKTFEEAKQFFTASAAGTELSHWALNRMATLAATAEQKLETLRYVLIQGLVRGESDERLSALARRKPEAAKSAVMSHKIQLAKAFIRLRK